MSDVYSIQVTSETFETMFSKNHRQPLFSSIFTRNGVARVKRWVPCLNDSLMNMPVRSFWPGRCGCGANASAGMGVRSLPTVVLFKNGQQLIILGALSDGEIRAILDKHVERVEASPLERAAELVALGQYDEAIALYQRYRR